MFISGPISTLPNAHRPNASQEAVKQRTLCQHFHVVCFQWLAATFELDKNEWTLQSWRVIVKDVVSALPVPSHCPLPSVQSLTACVNPIRVKQQSFSVYSHTQQFPNVLPAGLPHSGAIWTISIHPHTQNPSPLIWILTKNQ